MAASPIFVFPSLPLAMGRSSRLAIAIIAILHGAKVGILAVKRHNSTTVNLIHSPTRF